MTVAESRRRRRLHLLLAGSLLVALVLQVAAAVTVWRAVGLPFPGFTVYGRLSLGQLNQPYWSGIRAGLRPGDVIMRADGDAVGSLERLFSRVRAVPPGTPIRYTVGRGAEVFDVVVPTMVFGLRDFAVAFGLLAVTALVFVLGGTAIAWFRPDPLGLGVFAFSWATAFNLGGPIRFGEAGVFTSEELLGIPLRIAALLHLALVFPEPVGWIRRDRRRAVFPYVACLPLVAANVAFSLRAPELFSPIDALNRWLTFAAALTVPASIMRVLWNPTTPAAAEKARLTLWGALLAMAAYGIGFVGTTFGWLPPAPHASFVFPAWIWLITLAIASAREDVFDLGGEARAKLAALAVLVLAIVACLSSLALAMRVLRGGGAGTGGVLLGGAFLSVAVLLYEPVRRTVAEGLSGGLRNGLAFRPKALREISADLAASLDEGAVQAVISGMPPHLGLDVVERVGIEQMPSPLRAALEGGAASATAQDLDPSSAQGREARAWLGSRKIDLLVALRTRDRCLGALGFGRPARGGSISPEDHVVLVTLAHQTAVALENVLALRRIAELERQLQEENVILKEELVVRPEVGGLVGQSAAMQRLYAWIHQVAASDATVLLRGETGTGKELVARALHAASPRRDRPMIRVSCAAVPASLLESEFFGYERGSFTGALAQKIGRFELADGGTLFLDEIGDLPQDLQPKLLRFLQEREFQRVGGTETLRVDARVIAATNRDLETLVRQGRFRQDLFFRLNVLNATVPPLRERREDVPGLVAHLLQRHAVRLQRRVRGIEEASLRALERYHWPGNVRELENVIERALVLSPGDTLVIRELVSAEAEAHTPARPRTLAQLLREVKVENILRALDLTSGNQLQAAGLLGLRPSSLSRMMKQLGLRGREAPGGPRDPEADASAPSDPAEQIGRR